LRDVIKRSLAIRKEIDLSHVTNRVDVASDRSEFFVTSHRPKEIGLLLTEENAIAALEGRKTQTRRIITSHCNCSDLYDYVEGDKYPYYFRRDDCVWNSFQTLDELSDRHSKYGKTGDLFYLQEPTQVISIKNDFASAIVRYRDGIELEKQITEQDFKRLRAREDFTKKTSSRFMLKSFARHWFVNEGVKPEILQQISAEDAIAEGLERVIASRERFGCRAAGMLLYQDYRDSRSPWRLGFENPVESFQTLWDSINTARGYGWYIQPWWVWAIKFKPIQSFGNHQENSEVPHVFSKAANIDRGDAVCPIS
jgi:hypothetical protein